MSGLAEFLRARLDEDEARAIRGNPDWRVLLGGNRALREVAAKRAILALHVPLKDSGEPPQCVICLEYMLCRTLRHLAAVYSDHPDYRVMINTSTDTSE